MTTAIIQSGLGGSRVLVSPDAAEFDPNSLLDDQDDDNEKTHRNLSSLIVLTLNPPGSSEEFQVGGFFVGLNARKNKLVVELNCLFPIAIELWNLATKQEPTTAISVELRGLDPSCLIQLGEYQLCSVRVGSPEPSNNQVRVKVVLSRDPI